MSRFVNGVKENISKGIISVFNFLPIKKNKIFIYSYYGSQYGCSPKYISKYLVENYPKDKFDIVWAFNDIESKEHIEGIRKVKTMSLKYFYELCTSKIIITNFRTTKLFKKRKDQYYIQTWHSSLRLKQIEKDAEDSLPKNYVEMAKEDSKKLDLLVSGCKFSTDIFKRAFWYDGEIFEKGTPATDIIVNEDLNLKNKIFEKLKINKESKIIMYAPTFRKNTNISIYNLDYDLIMHTLNKRFSGEWKLLVRLHPHLLNISSKIRENKNVINVTNYDDVQELILISDVLITDYSSIMFSFLNTKRPCFLYTPDLFEYTKNDRKLYFNINELPFSISKNNEEIIKNILNFNEEKYKLKTIKMLKKIGSYEDGNAAKFISKKIIEVIG